MRTKLSFAALAALALASCSSDELLEQNSGSAINFSVVADKATRADIKTDNLDNFKVWSFKTADGTTNGDPFINNMVCSKSGDNWVFNGQTMFWPTENLNFYMVATSAAATGTNVFTPSVSAAAQKVDFTAGDGTIDFVYAMCQNQAKKDHLATPINVNFRHALSKVVFKLGNTNANLRITVAGIRVVGINDKGTCTLASTSTYGATKGECSWESQASSKTQIADVAYTALTGANTLLTAESTEVGTPLYLVPQVLPTWTVTKVSEGNYTATGTARIEILCKIEQKTGEGAESYSVIWDGITSGKYIAVSLDGKGATATDLDWLQGKKYIYTLSFGQGAGYDPTDPAKPEPTLVAIKAAVTVEEFVNGVDGANGEINSDVKPN